MITYNNFNKLRSSFNVLSNSSIMDLFNSDCDRVKIFTKNFNGLYLDLSKNLITKEVVDQFIDLAKEMKIIESIKDMFSGKKINFTENRAVLHSALRSSNLQSLKVDNVDICSDILFEREKFKKFVQQFENGKIKGYTNKNIKSIVNIGIGGSYLGSQMVYNSLKHLNKSLVEVYFVSNIDASNLQDILNKIDCETTLFIVASKTFTTQETMTNANTIKEWFIQKANKEALYKHFIALSTNVKEVEKFGINKEWMFGFWDFVGGRYSVWSSIGLPLALAFGNDVFDKFLSGAELVDKNLQEENLWDNLPFLLAIIGIWYNNFFHYNSYAILPYDYRLRDFTRYIQQLEMESNGKSINKYSKNVSYETSPIVFGEVGSDSQHSFFQMLHQGTQIIPCDFVGFIKSYHNYQDHQDILIANLFAQAEAFLVGKSYDIVFEELKQQGLDVEEIKKLAPHKVFNGNRPSNIFLFDELNPKNLGMLCALYEHKILIQGLFWEINSFDQWGVELGKKLANNILKDFQNNNINTNKSSSTIELIKKYKNK